MSNFPNPGDVVKLCDLKTHTDLNNICCNCISVIKSENSKPFIMVKLDFEYCGKYVHKIHPNNYKVISKNSLSIYENNKMYDNFIKNVKPLGIN